MFRSLVLVALMVSPLSALASDDSAAARVPLEAYLEAQATGNGQRIRDAFWPEGHMVLVRDGKLVTLTAEEFAARFTGKPAPTAAQTKRTIERVDVTGDVAVGVITLDGPTHRITDYLTLLKKDGTWRIIHKSFHAQSKSAPPASGGR